MRVSCYDAGTPHVLFSPAGLGTSSNGAQISVLNPSCDSLYTACGKVGGSLKWHGMARLSGGWFCTSRGPFGATFLSGLPRKNHSVLNPIRRLHRSWNLHITGRGWQWIPLVLKSTSTSTTKYSIPVCCSGRVAFGQVLEVS